MARTVDPARHEARRMQIIDAALTCFARDGYQGATTAAICREAGIGSGTFFHYFPTKLDVLLAILTFGLGETTAWFEAQRERTDAITVIDDWVAMAAEESTDARLAGFIRAVSALVTDPAVAEALSADERVLRDGLLPWVRRAVADGDVRDDVEPERLVAWVMAVHDGYLGRVASDESFAPEREQRMLHDAVRRLLAPAR